MADIAAPADARLHDLDEVQQRLKVGRSTVFALITSGELRSVKIRNRRLVSESALVAFIDRLEANANAMQRGIDQREVSA
ncbi:helix-turn-helix domain-containing protein [Mycobacterium marinum]|uniref:helix-turn-helix domain-containing protein n=1 Tax=Mycobacterium marinum TaxID=1781 RepID=UPI001923C417|nr:helix-turn-helix domain-containing protein [Mycobacterium marinum]QQW36877.1 helix-turn-helix domain-containing protein [Mycobacterium marinum]